MRVNAKRKSKSLLLKAILILVLLISLLTAAVFVLKIWKTQSENTAAEDSYSQIAELARNEAEPEETPVSAASMDAPKEEINEPEYDIPAVDFDTLHNEVNENIIAWLYCPETVIDYPVVQGEDNDYYLRHLADGTFNYNGCLFIDYRNDSNLLDRNTYIYGHHMQSGAMFASIVNYSNEDYYHEHPVLFLTFGKHQYLLEPFSGYTTTKNGNAYEIEFSSDHEYAEWLRSAVESSEFIPDAITISTNDQIITLSTCAYSFNDARYVLHCKLTLLS